MSIAEKLTTVADNVPKVYESGKEAIRTDLEPINETVESVLYGTGEKTPIVDESKIIPKTVSGSRFVSVDDVSEVRHNVEIEVSSDCGITVCGKNLCPNDWETGFISTSTGLNQSSDASIRTKDYFTFDKNQPYHYISSDDLTSSNTIAWYFYDENKTFIKRFVSYKDKAIGLNEAGVVIPSDVFFYRLAVNTTDVNIRVQLEKGSMATAYEPYCRNEYTTTDGKATVKSLSPYMTIIADSDVNVTMNYRKSYGMQTEYDRFWDAYQENGNRTDYQYAFAGVGWTVDTFKPKYTITGNQLGGIFYRINLNGNSFSLREALKDIEIDTSKSTSGQNLFYYACVSDCPTLNFTSASNLNTCFSYSKVKYIEKIILKDDGSQTFTNTFISCTMLTDITIEGTIGQNFDIHWSPLTHDSLMSIINHLATVTEIRTLTLGSTNLAKLTDDEKKIATERGWTLA